MKKGWILLPILCLLLMVGIVLKIRSTQEKRIGYFGQFKTNFCLNKLCLYKDGEDWVYQDEGKIIPADNDLVEIYKQKFSELEISDIVSNNKDKFADFGFEGDPLLLIMNGRKLEIGKMKNDLTGSYVREENGKVVYLVPGINLDKDSMRKARYWDRKFVINLADSMIKKVTQTKNDTKIEKQANEIETNALNNLSRLRIVDFWDNKKPEGTIEELGFVLETANKNIDLRIGKTAEPKYWAATDDKFYYQISPEEYGLLTGINK